MAAPRVAAQGATANVSGTVTDETGLPLPGVTVTITNTSNGRSQVIVTGAQGNYRAVALQPAPYQLTAELPGFATIGREITLNVGADSTVDFR
ncbi:MAG: carboxypeptidase-like regulatory domain-containing protein, partial [Geminicoccales bacterium]